MAFFPQIDLTKIPRYKVELHVHLDGSVRLSTVWDLAQKKGIKLAVNTLEELYNYCHITRPTSLEDFLKPFHLFLPVIAGDPEAIERVAYEFCEDAVKQRVFYTEVRYCPHLLSSIYTEAGDWIPGPLSPRDVVMCVNKGLSRGSTDFRLTVRSILCCFRGKPEWSNEILDLCIEFQRQGVVGIDIAGDEATGLADPCDIEVFHRAARRGIHRTVHAGEVGPASNVSMAITEMFAERIGHGYHVVDDPALYKDAQSWGVHFETCPYSSCLTGAVPAVCTKHPIVRFAEDNINFSISRDDPTLINKTLDEEYESLMKLGLKEIHIIRANLNAAHSCFLPTDEKNKLIQMLQEIYGLRNDSPGTQSEYIPLKAMSIGGDV